MERRDSRPSLRGHIFRPIGVVVDGAECAPKMRRIRREWLADERARLEFTLRVRHCPYISA